MGNRRFLLAAVFIGGICSLGIELSASRLLAPFFGTSQLIWANVIGLTLIYLTIGYRLGGRLVDRRPEERLLGTIMLSAGLVTAVIPLLARPILQWSASAFSSFSVGVFIGSLFGVLLLFSVPIILLGMISPFAIRLSIRDVESAGSTAGALYGSVDDRLDRRYVPAGAGADPGVWNEPHLLYLCPDPGDHRCDRYAAARGAAGGACGARCWRSFQLGIRGIREPFCCWLCVAVRAGKLLQLHPGRE